MSSSPKANAEQSAGLRRRGVDPDVDMCVPAQRREWSAHRWVLPTIAVGGMAGASARYLMAEHWPTPAGGVPWTTLTINATGSLLIGVLMVFVVEVGGAHPLLRPFLGVGVLGGYTTFSTYTVETALLLTGSRPGTGVAYLLGTVLAAITATTLGVALARSGALLRRHLIARTEGAP